MQLELKRVCVFAGTRSGVDPAYEVEAKRLGALLAEAGVEIVYGGGGSGLMGTMSDTAIDAGGRVIGVLAPGFEMEVTENAAIEIEIKPNVALRKHYMSELADAFIALPGGYGTADEIHEVIISRLAHEHAKPLVLIDVNDFWQGFEDMCKEFVRQGFAGKHVCGAITKALNASEAIAALTCPPQA